jgi:hypothetical protein
MITIVETREDALRRLLQIARESGVRLLRDDSGEMWATSVSDPDWLHKVEPNFCGCRGFARVGRCRHIAALWSYLGYFDPEPPTPISTCNACGECQGQGMVSGTISTGSTTWRYGSITCPDCDGAGTVAA